jgi:hypothetical protein
MREGWVDGWINIDMEARQRDRWLNRGISGYICGTKRLNTLDG